MQGSIHPLARCKQGVYVDTCADDPHLPEQPLVKRALEIIADLKPAVWFIENPMGGALSKRPFMQGLTFTDVSYCHYGTAKRPWLYQKNTRIWTNLQGWQGGRVCKNDCPGISNGRHAGLLITVKKPIAGQVPPALIRGLFSAACVQLTSMNSTEKKNELYCALKSALMSQGVNDENAAFVLQKVQDIQPPQKTPKRVDLMIKINDKRYRSMAKAAAALLEIHDTMSSSDSDDDVEEELVADVKEVEAEEPAPVQQVDEKLDEILADIGEPPAAKQASQSKDIHYHFHITIPSHTSLTGNTA